MTTYNKILEEWNAEQENRKALFTEFLYQKSGRTNGLFNGLWEEWCQESGERLRDEHFDVGRTINVYANTWGNVAT